ncbi:MAG TPA: Lar family restriction alleviation protein [Pararhizobium sp.]|nr:Lar family restriction alleviation protein [Pararhizobium sp.]
MEALKPCPLCGGKAEIWHAHEENSKHKAWIAWIACADRCLVLTKEYDTDEQAIAAWNRRPPSTDPRPAAQPGVVKALTRAGGAMANILYNLKQGTFGTERIREQMDEAQSEWDRALNAFSEAPPLAAPVSQPANPAQVTDADLPEYVERAIVALQEHLDLRRSDLIAAIGAGGQKVAWRWFNNCANTAVEALRYLSKYDRPTGGEEPFNAAHLHQIAYELEHDLKRLTAALLAAKSKGGQADG